MFQSFYHLREQPFGVNPDPRFLYLSKTHREAFSSLLYRIQSDSGFLAMIAPPGMGKTTLLFHLLHRLQATAKTAFIFQTQCTSNDLLRNLLSEFDRDANTTDSVQMFRELKSLLLTEANAGRRCVLIIDEAQNLGPEVLETIRLLSNFETPRKKLLNIVLSGQAELGDMLSSLGLRQLRQRMSCITYLQQFSPAEAALYIAHRLEVAGYPGKISDLFSIPALVRIAHLSQGVPRVINNLCFNALSLGYALESPQVDLAIIDEVASDLGISLSQRPHLWQTAKSGATDLTQAPTHPEVDHSKTEGDILSAVAAHQEKNANRYKERDAVGSPATVVVSDNNGQQIPASARSDISSHASVSDVHVIASAQETEKFTVQAAEPAQPALEPSMPVNPTGVPRKAKAPLVVRSLAWVLVLCVAPLSGIQLHRTISAHADVNESSSSAGNDVSKSVSQETSTNLGSASRSSKPVNSRAHHRINTRFAHAPENQHKGMPVDTAFAASAPEPPNSESIESATTRDEHKGVDLLGARSAPWHTATNSGYVAPKPIWQPAPTYEPLRRHRPKPGDVELMLSVSSAGDVYRADVLKGSRKLAHEAEKTVKTWKYSPALSNGVPVNSKVYVTIQFEKR